MIKEQRRALAVLIPITIALISFWYIDGETEEKLSTAPSSHIEAAPKIEFKTPSRFPASVPLNVRNPVIIHTNAGLNHPVWKEKVEKTLLTQAAGNLKKAEIEKVDSFQWKMGKVDVQVDSIIVKLEHTKGHRSSFRAIVDASNGKILQTWDHPVLDNFDPKTRYGVKVDPRYHND